MEDSNYANDNEPNPWSTIGLQAALIVNRLRCQAQILELQTGKLENGTADDKRDDDRAKEDQTETKRADIERRVRDILAMENRLRRKTI